MSPNTNGPLKVIRKGEGLHAALEYEVPYDTCLEEQIGKWYNAYHIHRWFEENVRGVTGDCGEVELSRQELNDLWCTVVDVLETVELVETSERVDRGFDGVEVRTPIRTIKRPSTAQALLPVKFGLFKSSVDYDQHYVDDVYRTKAFIQDALRGAQTLEPLPLICYQWA